LLLAWLVPLSREGHQLPEPVRWYWSFGSVGIAAVALVVSLVSSPRVQSVTQRCGATLMRPSAPVFAAFAAATAASLATFFAIYAFRGRATTSDEIAQLWQAKILLNGRLSLPPDPNFEFFAIENVIDSGRWYAQFPIGGAFVLVPGALLGVPWLGNVVLVAVATLALYAFARRIFGEMQGRAVAALFAVTPMVLFMAGTWMNHTSVLCLVAIVLLSLVEWERARTTPRALLWATSIGLALGLIATIRPLDAVIVAVPVGVFQLWVIRGQSRRVRELAVQVVFGLIGIAPVLYANAATTGSPFRFGYEVMWGSGHQIGFRIDPYGNHHTVAKAVALGMKYVTDLNISLVTWPIPALLVLIVGLLAFRRVTRWDVLLIALFVAQLAAYASYSLVGDLLGPRFLYTALPTLVVILARTPFLVGERAGSTLQRATLVTILTCILVSWSVPWVRFSVLGLAKDTRNARRIIKMDIAGAVRDADIHRAVVFLREPLGQRLLRRLWGLGMGRSEAVRLLADADACSLLAAISAAETNTRLAPSSKVAFVVQNTAPFTPSRDAVQGGTPRIRISSLGSIPRPCGAESRLISGSRVCRLVRHYRSSQSGQTVASMATSSTRQTWPSTMKYFGRVLAIDGGIA
jgi:hypothetical protein